MKRDYLELDLQSIHLNRSLQIRIYGKYGFIFLMFPSKEDNFNEEFDGRIISNLMNYINSGYFRIAFIPTINNFIWLNDLSPTVNSEMQKHYNDFIVEELVPRFYQIAASPTPLIPFGCGLGGYFASNTFFRRPDIFHGLISIDGFFDHKYFSKDYFYQDNNCYYNSPIDFLALLEELYWLMYLRTRNFIYLIADSDDNYTKTQAEYLKGILDSKHIPNHFELFSHSGTKIEKWVAVVNNLTQRILAL